MITEPLTEADAQNAEAERNLAWLAVDSRQALIDDVRAIHTEMLLNSSLELIIGYHKIGERIATDNVWNARGNGETLTDLSKSTRIGERTLYRAVKFYRKYPSLDALWDSIPFGKNITWNKIIALLPDETQSGNDDKYVFRVSAAFGSVLKLASSWTEQRQRDFLADLEAFKKRWFGNKEQV